MTGINGIKTDNKFKLLKEELFKRGYAAIEEFLGFKYNEHWSKDSIDNLMDEVYQQMPESTLYKYFAKYNIENCGPM